MISYCIICIVLFTSYCLTQKVDPNYNYQVFMRQFQRTYKGLEKQQHKKIFDQNYAELLRYNENGANLIVSQFLDWTQNQKRQFFNYQPDKSKVPRSSKALRSSGIFNSPSKFDWRSYDKVTDVKNQRSCGSCWAFASTAQYESILAIANPAGGKLDLSEQYALQCDKNSNGCNGGAPYSANILYNKTGIPLETQYPYKANSTYYTNNSIDICEQTNTAKVNYAIRNFGHYYNLLTIQEIQLYLVTYGPLSVAVYASDISFYSAGQNSALISCPSTINTNHAVLLIGYNETHWFIKNSWDVKWGDKGFGYIDKKNDCGLHTYIDVMEVQYPNPPVPLPNPIPPGPYNGPIPGTVNITVYMADTGGDGWQGTVIGFRQNKVVVGTFGAQFTTGLNYGNVTITIPSQQMTQIVVTKLGGYTKQVRFIVYGPDGTPLFQRQNGTSFSSTIIFFEFCPTQDCKIPNYVKYYVTLTDTYGDGWNGNVLAFRQNDIYQTFTLASGRTSDTSISFDFFRLINVDVVVSKYGTWTEEIGFQIRTAVGELVAQRKPTKFNANDILLSFCPQCVNLSPVVIAENISQDKQNQSSSNNNNDSISVQSASYNIYKITTFILAPLFLITLFIAIVTTIKVIMLTKVVQENDKSTSEKYSIEKIEKIGKGKQSLASDFGSQKVINIIDING